MFVLCTSIMKVKWNSGMWIQTISLCSNLAISCLLRYYVSMHLIYITAIMLSKLYMLIMILFNLARLCMHVNLRSVDLCGKNDSSWQ